MHARARTIAIVAVLVPGLLLKPWSFDVPVASAQQDASTAEARKRFQEGVKLFDEKKYDLARTAFLQAYALKRHPDILLNLAQCELAGGRPLESSLHFRDFLRDPATSTHPKRVDAERGLGEARLKLGRVQVRVDAPDAEVLVDGARVGSSPLPEAVDVAPGNHLVEARLGARTLTRSVNAPAGHIVPLDFSFGVTSVAPPPPATTAPPPSSDPTPPPAPTAEPGARTPPPPPGPGPGPAPPPETGAKPSFPAWAFGTPVGLIGTGLFVGGLAFGGTFAVLATGSKGDAEDLRKALQDRAASDAAVPANQKENPCASGRVVSGYENDCTEASDAFDSNKQQRLFATIGLAAAGVGLVTLAAGYVMAGPKAESAAVGARYKAAPARAQIRVSPLLGPSTAGLGVGGSF